MKRVRSAALASFMAALSVLGLYGCGGEAPTPTPPPATATSIPATATTEPPTSTPEPPTATTAPSSAATSTPEESMGGGDVSNDTIALMGRAQKAMTGLNSYHFTMQTDAGLGINIGYEGDFQKPNKVRMQTSAGTQASTEMIIIGDESYFKQPGTDSYIALGENSGQAGLASPENAMSFADFASSAQIEGEEDLSGVSTTRVSFTYDVNKAQEAFARRSGTPFTPTPELGTATGEMWIEKGTSYTRQLKIVTAGNPLGGVAEQPGTSGESTLTITYSRFNEPVDPPIEKPSNVMELPTGIGTPAP